MDTSPIPPRYTGLDLDDRVVAGLRDVLPRMAERTVTAVMVEVPSYADAFGGRMGQTIENAVQLALGAFLRLVTRVEGSDPGQPLSPALDGAYELGRGEARSGRSIDALLSAYRVGARVAWRELSATAVDSGVPAATIARFAELVFAFIDELSASSVSGHGDELAITGRVRERYRERLGLCLLKGDPIDVVLASAERADWEPPETLTAVLMPRSQVRGVATLFGPSTLLMTDDLPGIDSTEQLAVLLVPDMAAHRRSQLLAALQGRRAFVGPDRPWAEVESSYRRALRALHVVGGDRNDVVDTDAHLVELVVGADREAADDLRRRALAPLMQVRPKVAARLAETLRSWILHKGQRDAVAAELFVHAQTVRYRMTQVRDLYGDRLDDPRTILELTVALSDASAVPGVFTP